MSEKKPLPEPRALLFSAADRAAVPEEEGRHPLNPACEIHGWILGRRTGLTRVGVNLIRVPPGKESTELHVHHSEEEFAYVLSGRGEVELGPEVFAIGPGDFLGFPPGTHAHNLRNTGAEDLVFLAGGESHATEIADFPRARKRMVKLASGAEVHPLPADPWARQRG